MAEEIIIKRAVLHILDNNVTMPVLSDRELDIDEDRSNFIGKHIERIMSDNNAKMARFNDAPNFIRDICCEIKLNPDFFLQGSIGIAEGLFSIMQKNVDIPPADLICCLFYYESQPHLGILKLNYKTGYTHYVEQGEEGNINTIIRYRTLLPSESQKADECVLINLESLEMKLIEKAYEINGEREYYFSGMFLNCTTQLSDNEKVKIINKVAQKINKKYYDEDFETAAKLKKAISDSFEETKAIQLDNLVEEVFDKNVEIRNEYMEEIHKAGLTEKSIPIPEKLAEKKFRTHRIKTDTGIEINFPPSLYNNKEKIEFVNNSDGTISIIIKNVGKIINK
mgnify:FL=1